MSGIDLADAARTARWAVSEGSKIGDLDGNEVAQKQASAAMKALAESAKGKQVRWRMAVIRVEDMPKWGPVVYLFEPTIGPDWPRALVVSEEQASLTGDLSAPGPPFGTLRVRDAVFAARLRPNQTVTVTGRIADVRPERTMLRVFLAGHAVEP